MKRTVIVMLVVLCGLAAGCGNTQNGNTQNGQAKQQARQADRGTPIRQMDDASHRNHAGSMQNGMDRTDADDRVEVADRAAAQIVQLADVRQANVLVTRRNAYVAAVLDNDAQKLSRDIEDRIAERVRAADPNIRNVYVSTNPDFVDRVNDYVAEVQQGRPVAGFVDQFNEMVQRLFPNAR